MVALGAAKQYAELDDVSGDARMLVVLDGLEDPHNLGAVIRTAHAAGADAVLVPERRAAGLTETVAKAAAGALEHLIPSSLEAVIATSNLRLGTIPVFSTATGKPESI